MTSDISGPVVAPHGRPGVGRGRFVGSVAVITGGSRGIGLAVARRLVDEGAHVIITGRTQSTLNTALEALGPAHAVGVCGDTTDPEHRRQAVSTAVERFGSVDLLVNNVGVIGPREELASVSRQDFLETVEVNCVAPLGWVKEVCGQGLLSGGGAIVNVSSALARTSSRTHIGVYVATKAMLESLTVQLAMELAPTVRVNAVAPGLVRTELGAARFADREQEVVETYPMGRIGEAEDVAASVVHLLSPDSRWVTGQSLVVDGGILSYSAL